MKTDVVAPRHGVVHIKKNSLLLKHRPFLKSVYNSAKKKKSTISLKKLIHNASDDEINTLSEIAKNILLGNLPPKHIKRLKPFKNIVRKLASPHVNIQKKRTSLQRGGVFLGALLAPILGSVLGGALSSAIGQ